MVPGNVDKFAVAGLTRRALNVGAPYIEEFPLVVECRSPLIVGYTQFVGEIMM
jgi:flavin reductase (DIM6/NTAB) family NADH-FMN oxidoreductase RutF